jgi:ubiquinone biosynthesis protein
MKAKASLSRFRTIFFIAARHAVLHALHRRLASWPKLAHKLPGENIPGPKRLRLVIEEIGGTFIKFGQMLAMQSDLLPLNYCAALFSLFDQVPPFSYEEVEKTFVEDLGQSPFEIFEAFDTKPIATGSIGQVHVASLHGRKAAVKVRRPTIVSDFDADIAAMKFTVHAVKLLRIHSLYWIIAPTEEFIAWTQDELDYRREAHYIDELGRNARANEFERVPAVFWSCTTARILTMEFLEGITISEFLRQSREGTPSLPPDFDPELFGSRLVDNFLGDAFRHGMFHADLHPGNLMILPGNIVGYIDFGISGVLSGYSRRHLIALTLAYAQGDLDRMCESFFQITTFDRTADLTGFRRGLEEISVNWYGDQLGEPRLRKSITLMMLDLLLLSRENGIWPQRDVIKYIRSAIAMDGLVKTFAPDLNIGRHLEETCKRYIRQESFQRLFSSEALAGWYESATNLLQDGFFRVIAGLRLQRPDSSNPFITRNRKQSISDVSLSRRLGVIWTSLCAAVILWPSSETSRQHQYLLIAVLLGIVATAIWRFRSGNSRRFARERK